MSEKAPKEVDDHATASFREFREYARGNLDVDHRHVHEWAGLVRDPEVRRVLGFMAETYEPERFADRLDADVDEMPREFEETDFFEAAIRRFGTDTASEALEDGHIPTISYISGLPSYESDISGLHAINQLADWLIHSENCKLIYLAALMGRGKTDLSLTLLEIVADHYDRLGRASETGEVQMPEFAANFAVEPDGDHSVRLIDNYDDMLEWAESGSSEENRWYIFDEASTELTAQSGKNAQKVAETMGPFVKKMRKLGINMIVIGHDRGDIHVAIRSLADFIDKTGIKTASFYAGIEAREPVGHLFDVAGIPPTSWEFDTDDMASWEWGSAADGEEADLADETDLREMRDERMARLYAQTEITQGDLADAFDVSQPTVSDALKRIQVETDTPGAAD